MSKLNLKFQIVKNCRRLAMEIVNPISDFIEKYTTVSIERTVLDLLGANGVNSQGEPRVNFLVDNLKDSNFLGKGSALYFTNALMHLGNLENLSSKIEKENFRISDIPLKDKEKIKAYALQEAEKGLNKIKNQKEKREVFQKKYPSSAAPLIYVIVATGNIY
ncbi:MAG: D-lysine 5,6-aminomutase subunit alpha, partial [Armatimonadetes bacterium]|nr:D-lysine 5,6-aminomutase subunit alpha [Armatimonadota bacterium]